MKTATGRGAVLTGIPTRITDPFGPDARWTGLSATVLTLCFLINGMDGANVMAMSYLAPVIARDWHLSSTVLGFVFSSLLVGMGIGGLFIAPLADRYGRRNLVLICLLLMATGMILTGIAQSIVAFAISRAIVGLGIGTVLACMSALVYEFAPARNRSAAVAFLQAGYPIAAAISGFVTVWALGHFSWRSIMIFAGVVTLACFPVTFALLPESVGFLLHAQPRNALDIVNRIRQRMHAVPLDSLPELSEAAPPRAHLSVLLSSHLRRNTLLLWSAIFCGFFVLYSVISWIPRLAIEAGLDTNSGIVAGAIYNGGAFAGTFAISLLTRRADLRMLVFFFLLAAAVFLMIYGHTPAPAALVLANSFAVGVTLQGGFNGIYPLASSVYPVRVRSTGIGCGIGIGRAGAIAGPLVTGYLLSTRVELSVLFLILAAPLTIASISCLVLERASAD